MGRSAAVVAVMWIRVAALGLGKSVGGSGGNKREEFTNLWVAKVVGGEQEARRIAHDAGFTYRGQAAKLEDYYVFLLADRPPRSNSTYGHRHTETLLGFKQVEWAEQQRIVRVADKAAASKAMTTSTAAAADRSWAEGGGVWLGAGRRRQEGDPAKVGSFSTRPDPALRPNTSRTTGLRPHWTSAYAHQFDDPSWKNQWYLHDYRTVESAVLDLNVVPVYRMGFTGRGVTVAAVDTGVQRQNRDIHNNYVDELAQDYLDFLPAADPSPGLGIVTKHGTQVAGVIAMAANNGVCGVGVAYNARITGIKSELDKDSTDLQRAAALSHRNDAIDVYSCSWSNDNDGTQLVERQPLTYRAVAKAAANGRGGKGNVFVFSSGNHRSFDSCASDSLSANPHVVFVAAADQRGHVAAYSEPCAAVMVAAYSGGHHHHSDNIVAPEVDAECGASFSGTSAAAPAVSAVVALTLEANPSLTYRDVMHLITMSAEVAPLADSDAWQRNGAGFWVSNDFGFGLLNAENMVVAALNWTNVPRRVTCTARSTDEKVFFGPNNTQRIAIKTDGCQDGLNGVVFLEQVELESTIYHGGGRGRVAIRLISPTGTNTTLMEPRYWDDNRLFDKWNILSVQNWGENPKGTWYVEVADVGGSWIEEPVAAVDASTAATDDDDGAGAPYAKHFSLTMHGTGSPPAHSALLPRATYTAFRLPDNTTSWSEPIA